MNLANLERVVEFARRPPIEDDGVNQTVPATGAAQPSKRNPQMNKQAIALLSLGHYLDLTDGSNSL